MNSILLLGAVFLGTFVTQGSCYGFGSVQRLGAGPSSLSLEQKSYNVTQNGTYCIQITGRFLFSVVYAAGENKTLENVIKVPRPGSSDLTVTGYCNATQQAISLNWGKAQDFKNMDFVFVKVGNTSKWTLSTVNMSLMFDSSFQNGTHLGQRLNASFSNVLAPQNVPFNYSYACRTNFNEKSSFASMNGTQYQLPVHFEMKTVHISAFNSLPKDSPVPSHLCLADEIPGIVPIVIGCILLVMIGLVVLAVVMRYRNTPAATYQEI